MGIFDKLFGGSKEKEEKAATSVIEKPPCLHSVLVPRWDNAGDMGNEDLATAFMCEACHETFTPEQARAIRDLSTAAQLVGPGPGEEIPETTTETASRN